MLRKRFNSVLAATLLTVATTGTALAVGDPKDTGDIVMRDMKGLGGLIGHVGIWTGSDLLGVLEVVPEFESPAVIKTTSLKEFKTASTYRGAKYDGKGSAAHYKVIASGWAQRLFAPTYTAAPIAQEGKMEFKCKTTKPNCQKEWVLTPAKFRCDTFVWYAYKNGIGVDLLDGKPLTVLLIKGPGIIFGSVPNTR